MKPSGTASAHTDTFARDHLPPAEDWPELVFDLPELAYPDRLNCGYELLDRTVAGFGPDRPPSAPATGRCGATGNCATGWTGSRRC